MAEFKIEDFGFSGCEPTGAIVGKIYYAPAHYIEKLPAPKDLCGDSPTAAANFEELGTVSEDITFKAGKGFHEFTTITETGEVTSTQIGEKGRRLMENSVLTKVAGSSPKLIGFTRWVKNQDLVILFKEVSTGNMRLLGSELIPAWIEAQEHKIEAAMEGDCSLTITMKDKQKYMAPVYTGEITLFPEENPEP